MDYCLFKDWLCGQKDYSGRAAADVVSRCKRIERILEKPIQTLVSTETALAKTLDALSNKSSEYLRPGSNPVTAIPLPTTFQLCLYSCRALGEYVRCGGSGISQKIQPEIAAERLKDR
jgi:hypothetical protein